MKEGLLLKKGGVLERTRWKREGGWETKDATDAAFCYLMEPCELEEGVTLRDIFLLIQKHIEILDAILGNWCGEIVSEGLSGRDKGDPTSIQRLELYWGIGEDSKERTLGGYMFPNFHGVGPDEDDPDATVNYGVDFTPAHRIIDLPVVLVREMPFYDDAKKYFGPDAAVAPVYQDMQYSLMHILYGIIWELSFFGSPTRRDEELAKLMQQVKEIEDGTAELIPLEDVLGKLREPRNNDHDDDGA